MVLKEQIDMAQSFKELKASFDAQMSEIRNDQENVMTFIKQLVQGNVLLHGSFSRFEILLSDSHGQLQNISSFISSLPVVLLLRFPLPFPCQADLVQDFLINIRIV